MPARAVPRCSLIACLLIALLPISAHAPVTADSDVRRDDAGLENVTLEIVSSTPGALAAAAAVTLSNRGRVLGDAPGVLLVEIPLHAKQRLLEAVDGEVRTPVPVDMRPPPAESRVPVQSFGPTAGAQVEVTNAEAWHLAGIDGSGVKIGVIDFFDVAGKWNVDEHGPLPVAGVNARCLDGGFDCTNEFFDGVFVPGDEHGVAVVEVIRDMAPGADIFLGQASTLSDYSALVDWFVANGVQVINRSLGSRYDGPGDGRGALDEVAADAVAGGILWVNSAGNNGQNHYYRGVVQLNGSNQVVFDPSGTDPFLPFTNCAALGGVRWANDWDKPAADRTDYDIFLWESPTGNPATETLVDSSIRDQRNGAPPIELLSDTYCPSFGNTLYLEVRWLGGSITGDVLEVLDYGDGIAAYTQAASSAAVSIVDSDERGVIAVGAVDPPSGGVIGGYSSQGPTNDGDLAPDVSAPSGFFSSIYGETFSGTSASSPVVAGAAALMIDANLAATPDSLGDLIRNTTLDRGAAGPDNVYGHGEFRLPAPPDPTGVNTAPSRFVALDTPARLLDTRPETATGPPDLIGKVWQGETLDLPIVGGGGIPATGVTAVVVNLVTVAPDQASFLQAFPTGQATLGGFSTLNADAAGQVRSNMAVVPIGDDGSISIYSIGDGHVIVDVLGWFEATSGPVAAGRFVELPAGERLVDTRIDTPIGPLRTNDVLAVPMPTGADPSQISSLVVTVTSTAATDPGWIQAFPASRPDAIAKTSTINVDAGSTVANTAIVPIDTGGIAITGFFAGGGSSHVIVDAIGYITSSAAPPAAAGRYVSVNPNRAFDSRNGTGALSDAQVVEVDASDALGVSIPADASAVVWNVAVVQATRPGFLRGWPAGQVEPTTSSLNWTLPGETRAGAAVTAVDGGRAEFRIEDGSANLPGPVGHLIADVFGYFT